VRGSPLSWRTVEGLDQDQEPRAPGKGGHGSCVCVCGRWVGSRTARDKSGLTRDYRHSGLSTFFGWGCVCRSGRSRSCQVQRSLNADFQDLLRLSSVGHGPCELERAHHEAENGHRAATFRYGIGVRKQCGQRRHVASQPFFVVLSGGQGLAGDFREQRRRGAPACRVFKVSAVQVPPDRALEVQTSPLIFIEAAGQNRLLRTIPIPSQRRNRIVELYRQAELPMSSEP
jgi:hypothetical protein